MTNNSHTVCVTQVLLPGPPINRKTSTSHPTLQQSFSFGSRMCQELTGELRGYDKVARLCCQTHWSSWSSFLRNESISRVGSIRGFSLPHCLQWQCDITVTQSNLSRLSDKTNFSLPTKLESIRCLSKVVFILHTRPVLKTLSKIESHWFSAIH